MSLREQVEEQLRDELHRRQYPLAVLVGADEALDWPARLVAHAARLAAQLCSDDDDLAAETVIDVMHALFPTDEPEPEWWQTPVGRVVARSVDADDTEAVTHSVAAAMLGVARGTVGALVHQGRLDRHPDGGVLRSSVLQRIASRSIGGRP